MNSSILISYIEMPSAFVCYKLENYLESYPMNSKKVTTIFLGGQFAVCETWWHMNMVI